MEYRKINDTFYVRIDKGEEIIGTLLDICRAEHIGSAFFTGIGGCDEAGIQTFVPEEGAFETEQLRGTLELINITGNIVSDENDALFHHTHAVFSYIKDGEHRMSAGHICSARVLYTAEIELRPVIGGVIRRKFDPETGTGFWKFED